MLQTYSAETSHFPLVSHYPLEPDAFKKAALDRAMDILGTIGLRSFTEEMIQKLFWCELRPEFAGRDTRITSSSFPKLQGIAFISNKAMFHIPPNTIFSEPSFAALAENLFHEAIHQKVNLEVTDGRILTEDFNYQTSPKIFIHWRSQQEARNQNWELDRAFHAACVYSGLLKSRERILNTDIEDFEGKRFSSSLADGRQSLDYLIGELQRPEHAAFFKPRGIEVIESLKVQAYVE